MKALILVGGFGTRLRPLTLTIPKPTVEFANRAMVLHQIEALGKVGVTEVILAVNYRPEVMVKHLESAEAELGVKISYSHEQEPLGTAGPLALAAEKLLEGGQPFFVLNSDITCEFPFAEMLAFHKQHGKEGTLMVTQVDDPSKYGVIISDENGCIQRFVEKPQVFVSNKINAGLYLFNPEILRRIPLSPTSIEREIFPKMAEEGQLFSMALTGFWMDIGQPKDYIVGTGLYLRSLLRHQPSLLASGESFVGPVLVSSSARIGEGCVIGPNVVIGPDCVIGDGVRLQNTTVLAGSTIRSHAWVSQSIIGWRSSVGRWARLQNVTVLGEDVQIADEVFVNGGKILPHKAISENIMEPSVVM